jgi:hypothetical protein
VGEAYWFAQARPMTYPNGQRSMASEIIIRIPAVATYRMRGHSVR